MNDMHAVVAEFSRLVQVDKIPLAGQELDIVATPDECGALARRLGLVSLESLTARLQANRTHGGTMVTVSGNFAAVYIQRCVVTLEALNAQAAGPVRAVFAPPELIPDESGQVDYEDLAEEEMEPIVAGAVDVGELTVQHLALAIDPYPRKEGAVWDNRVVDNDAAVPAHPFAVLADLKKTDK